MIHSQGQRSSLGLTAFKHGPFLTRVVRGDNELRVHLAPAITPGRHRINSNVHHCVKAISCSINYTRGNGLALQLLTRGLYFVSPQATSRANINDMRPLKRKKHLNKTYLFFTAKQPFMGFVTSSEQLKSKHIQDPKSLQRFSNSEPSVEGNCRMYKALSKTCFEHAWGLFTAQRPGWCGDPLARHLGNALALPLWGEHLAPPAGLSEGSQACPGSQG